jgi:pyruvyltransferase
VKYWCWRPEEGKGPYRNFGDELTGLLLERIYPHVQHQWVQPEDAEIIGVGSVLYTLRGRLKPGTAVWGTGGGYYPEDATEGLEFLAVRGALTRDNLGLPADTPLGDPALLLPRFIPPAPKKLYKLGFVKHMGDDREHHFQRDIDISCLQPPADVIQQITACERVISSSLHGWIVAYAYGIPCVPLPLDDGYKFMDFATTLGQPPETLSERLLGQLQEWVARRNLVG